MPRKIAARANPRVRGPIDAPPILRGGKAPSVSGRGLRVSHRNLCAENRLLQYMGFLNEMCPQNAGNHTIFRLRLMLRLKSGEKPRRSCGFTRIFSRWAKKLGESAFTQKSAAKRTGFVLRRLFLFQLDCSAGERSGFLA